MVLVVAYGNTLRRDDGAASVAVRGLDCMPGIEVVTAPQLLPEHAEPASGADLVVFVDARDGGTPGTVAVEEVEALRDGLPDAHALTPAALLALAREAFGVAPRAVAVTIAGEDFGLGEGLSPMVSMAIPALRTKVIEIAAGR
jgi:hydrogenase maturation protease